MSDEDSMPSKRMVPPMKPSAEARIVGKANLSVLEHAASNGGDASGFRLDFLTNCHMRDAVTEAYRDGYNAAITEDAMPSEMVSAQQLSDAGEDLVRLTAAKDAEIAALTEQRDRAMAVVEAARGFCGEAANCAPCRRREEALAALDAEAAAETDPLPPPQCR